MEGIEGEEDELELKKAQQDLERAEKEITQFEHLAKTIEQWKTQDGRIVGKAVLSPPIGVSNSPNDYMIDWCLYEVDESKIDPTHSPRNVIDLGTEIRPEKMTRILNPNVQNRHKFTYPVDRQLNIRGIIPLNEIKRPNMLDKDGNRCLLVLKRGMMTGLTIGIANEIRSYTRSYFDDGTQITAKEWAILGYSKETGAFSKKGDSGALIFDATARMGGLLTGGSGLTATSDITYATPMEFLLENIQQTWKRKVDVNVG